MQHALHVREVLANLQYEHLKVKEHLECIDVDGRIEIKLIWQIEMEGVDGIYLAVDA
jgi:hypothetical protein